MTAATSDCVDAEAMPWTKNTDTETNKTTNVFADTNAWRKCFTASFALNRTEQHVEITTTKINGAWAKGSYCKLLFQVPCF